MAKSRKKISPKIEKLYPVILCGFIGYAIADVGVLYFREKMIPQNAPPPSLNRRFNEEFISRGNYNPIAGRNMFAANGEIPEAIYDKSKGDLTPKDNEPIPSQLPLNLIGTLVHSNPAKSLAAIEIRGKQGVISYTVDKDIDNFAKVTKIERQKVIFRNLNSNQLEYIEMKKDGKLAFGASKGISNENEEVQKVNDNTFVVKKADILKYTNNLSSILMDARTTPNRDPGTGAINGFRLLDMKPGSIYEKLGLQRMDVLKSVNGTPVTSAAKAMELYNSLKNDPNIKLGIERNGKNEEFTYNVQ